MNVILNEGGDDPTSLKAITRAEYRVDGDRIGRLREGEVVLVRFNRDPPLNN